MELEPYPQKALQCSFQKELKPSYLRGFALAVLTLCPLASNYACSWCTVCPDQRKQKNQKEGGERAISALRSSHKPVEMTECRRVTNLNYGGPNGISITVHIQSQQLLPEVVKCSILGVKYSKCESKQN